MLEKREIRGPEAAEGRMTAATACGTCGTEPRLGARFCDACGSPIAPATEHAEYKQVTVLFADVVHSMEIAAAVDAERLREIMTELVDRATAVVKRYGGTVDKFTGDGIMALFGAPTAMEDHAVRACLAALDIQEETRRLAAEIEHRDRITLQLRVGLNSGEVIAGETGSGPMGYTAVGAQVGMAQRMESVAPPGAVMISESTARLVENTAVLGEPELLHIKGTDTPVRARQLLAIGEREPVRRGESTLVGRTWELNTVTAILEEAIGGAGCVVNIVGPAGIGKSRLVRETAAIAASRGVAVCSAYCESHARDLPFHVVARLLRAAMGVEDLDAGTARAHLRAQVPDADPDDLLLLDDLLGIRDLAVALPDIAPDARRRRLTALSDAVALARTEPSVYVIEDVHWIDEVSESMLTDFLTVVPQVPSLVLITCRPEYHGALTQVSGAQSIALRPLSDAQTSALTTELLGPDPSITGLAAQVAARAAGNPFFVEEMVRDLAERGVLHGPPGAYLLPGEVADVEVPATLQASLGARIDRLGPTAKRTLNAAAVIGSRFDAALLTSMVDDADVTALVAAELVDQVRFTPRAAYAFHHPLIRTVAYESQLKSDRAQLHRRLAAAIEQRDPALADENAALIAEHLEAAGDLHAAFAWHMRAGTWSTNRDIAAAHTSWQRARQVADRLPDDDPDRTAMRIAPRTLLSGSAWRVGGSGADTGFEELRELCTAAGDRRSLVIGMAGPVLEQYTNARRREASRLATQHVRLLESIGDPTLTVALCTVTLAAKQETAEMAEVLRVAQRAIDLADGDPTMGDLILGSPLAIAIAMRGVAHFCLGMAGWRDDLRQAVAMARAVDPMTLAAVMWFTYITAIPYGVLLPDATALRDTAEALALAEQSGDDFAVDVARTARGVTLARQDGAEREAGLDLLAKIRERALNERFSLHALPIADIHIAREKARLGDLDGTIGLSRAVVDELFDSGGSVWIALATTVLVEALLQRGGDKDVLDAQDAIDRLAAVPTDPGFVLHEITLLRLRALLARAHGDATRYRDYRDRYRDMAKTLGFEGHIAWSQEMP
jgi:adenylate cyclase